MGIILRSMGNSNEPIHPPTRFLTDQVLQQGLGLETPLAVPAQLKILIDVGLPACICDQNDRRVSDHARR